MVALSSQSLQMKIQTQLAIPVTTGTPPSSPKVQIGVDCDYGRTISTGRRVIGRRVVNRCISFREDLQDLPFSFQFCTSCEPSRVKPKSGRSPLTFEDALSEWVLERIAHCGAKGRQEEGACGSPWRVSEELKKKMSKQALSPSQAFAEWFRQFEKWQNLEQCICSLCLQFVQFFHVTHYVSAIKLGATEYAVMTESAYLAETKVTGKFGFEELVTWHVTASKSSHKSDEVSNVRRIGTIEKETGPGGKEHMHVPLSKEAVIRVEIKPAYHLVRHDCLGNVLKDAIAQYTAAQRDPRSKWSQCIIYTL